MAAYLILDDSEARAAAEELRLLVGDGAHVSRHMRERIETMLSGSAAVDIHSGPRGLAACPSPDLLSIIATLRAHRDLSSTATQSGL